MISGWCVGVFGRASHLSPVSVPLRGDHHAVLLGCAHFVFEIIVSWSTRKPDMPSSADRVARDAPTVSGFECNGESGCGFSEARGGTKRNYFIGQDQSEPDDEHLVGNDTTDETCLTLLGT